MATVSCTLPEEQFLCSICLEVFSAPVTTPCGHSFCRACINQHWDNSDRVSCPICKLDFSTRPQMKVNTVLAEMVSGLKHKHEMVFLEPQSAAPGHVSCEVAAPGEAGGVGCDVCPDLRAAKSCVVCMASYCENHLQPHFTERCLRWHPLVEPHPNMTARRKRRNICIIFMFIVLICHLLALLPLFARS